jgi:GntR family transcriptional regulator
VLNSLRIVRTGVPIYVQIREQVLRAIGAGVVRPGEKMPTMRQVAVALRVDLNTVRHAYDALARIGAITIQPARGTFVAERPPPTDATLDAKRVEDLALRTIAAARASGLEPGDVAYRILAIAKQQDDET